MITILKLAGLSAVLSAGVMTAYEAPKATAPDSVKLYHDRIAPDAPVSFADASSAVAATAVATKASAGDASPNCAGQTWPYVASDCIADGAANPARKVVRTITIERREAPNTSTLVRLPAETAPRR